MRIIYGLSRVLLLLVYIFFSFEGLSAQSTCEVSFFIQSSTITKDQTTLCVDIQVKDFTNILSFVLPISYPADVLSYTGVINQSVVDINIDSEDNGSIVLQWEEPSGFGTQNGLEDGSTLLTLCFDLLRIPQDEFFIEFSDQSGQTAAIVTNTEPFIMNECLFDATILVPCSISDLEWRGETFEDVAPAVCNRFLKTEIGGWFYEKQLPLYAEIYEGGILREADTLKVSEDLIFLIDMQVDETYRITITDTLGCRLDSSFTILNDPSAFEDVLNWYAPFTEVQHTCSLEQKGKISTYVSSADWPNTFMEWSHGPSGFLDGSVFSEVATQENLAPGIYTVTVSHSTCSITREFEILDIPQFELQPQIREPSCGGFDGSIQLIMDPPGEYTFEWINLDSQTDHIEGIGSGSYEVQVWDSLGCNKTERIVVAATDELQIDMIELINEDCEGGGLSTITVGPGYTTGRNLDYVWSTGDEDSGITVSLLDLGSGDYWVIATNNICSSDTFYFEISETVGSIDVDSISVTPPNCKGDLGSIELVGTSINDYSVDIKGVLYDPADLPSLAAGTYDIIISNDQGCQITEMIRIPEAQAFSIDIDSSMSELYACEGSEGIVFFQDQDQLTLLDMADNEIQTPYSVPPGTHTVYAINANGCRDTLDFFIDSIVIEQSITNAIPDHLCPDETIRIMPSMIFDNFEDGWTFILDGTEYDLDDLIDISSGNYTIEIMTDEGCQETINLDIVQHDLMAEHEEEYTGTVGETLSISLGLTDLSFIQSINWTPTDRVICIDPLCAIIDLTLISDETLSYEIIDTFGCSMSGVLNLIVEEVDSMAVDTMTIDTTIVDPMPPIDTSAMAVKTSIYLPNALRVTSPENNNLCVYATSDIVTVISFRLYDRWGNLHFDESGPIIDGRYCVSNSAIWSELQSGVYVYAVELQKSDGVGIMESGNVTVFK